MNKLLKRIEQLETLTERLEQTIFEIRNSCPCVWFEPDPGDFNCEPTCPECNCLDCICEPEEPEHECEDGCPSCRGHIDFPEEEPECPGEIEEETKETE
jgi:hypothetical protein